VVADYVWGLDLYQNINSTQRLRTRGSKNVKWVELSEAEGAANDCGNVIRSKSNVK